MQQAHAVCLPSEQGSLHLETEELKYEASE